MHKMSINSFYLARTALRTAATIPARLSFKSLTAQNSILSSSPPLTGVCGFSSRPAAVPHDASKSESAVSSEALCAVSMENGIKRIVLNNPKKRNALSLNMMTELLRCLTDGKEQPRVIILSANGPVFCSGHDLKELRSDTGTAYHEKVFRTCTTLMCAIEDAPVPVIAVVNGVAAAAGCQLIASCDMVVASTKSHFSTPGVSNGLFCSTPSIPLVRAVPKKIAAKMLYTGDSISAQEALQFGLVTAVVEETHLEVEVQRIAQRICDKSPAVVQLGKEFLKRAGTMDRAAAYREGESTMIRNLGLGDCQEGISAFFEKRRPKWTS